MVKKEKNGLEVMLVGKRLVVWDSNANVVERLKLNSYTWEVKR